MPGLNGLVVMKPTSISSTGTGNSSSIGANGKVTFSSCVTLSLNGVFTSSYDNYMIVLRANININSNILARLRLSGTDDQNSNYTRQYIDVTDTSIFGERATTSSWNAVGYPNANQRIGSTIYLFGPALAQPTAMRAFAGNDYLNAGLTDVAASHNQSTAYDGISFVVQTSPRNITGAVTVYGFNQ